MKTAQSLPIPGATDRPAAVPPRVEGLPRIERNVRNGALLHAGPYREHGDVLSLNIAQGCAHRCAFCSARAYPSYPGDRVIYLPTDTAERLAKELAARRQKPRAVYVSPSSDPFMPLAEVQAETCRVVEVLAEHDVEAWLMTRGVIRPAALAVLAANRDKVKVTVGLTTVDRTLQRVLEPLAAPPRLRLRQIAQLRDRGVPVHVEVAPLVPGVTDTRAQVAGLLESLALVGVQHITAGYMFLRPGIRDNLMRELEGQGLAETVVQQFADGVMLQGDGLAPARYLSRVRRQHGYAAIKALAAGLGISVSVCGLTNPDFRGPRRVVAEPALRQRLLPQFDSVRVKGEW